MTTNNRGETVLYCAVKHIDVVKYLINERNCDIMATDILGYTPFHCAADWGTPEVVEYFLSTDNCDPLAKDNEGRTPLQLAKNRGYNSYAVIAIFKKFGDIKISHPIDSYVSVLLVGNPVAGKSTLSHVINDTATGSIVLGSIRNVGGVVPCTAGIIPYKLQHRTLGNIILHDFAGHSEYYSSHSAVIENLLQGSGGVFLIVVNILEREAVKQLHQWLTVVRNEAQKALNECHVIVIVSHVDEISNPVERRRREEIQEIISERCDSFFLDCRKLGGSGVDSFFNKLSSACESIRSTSGRNLSLYCHMMYGLLEERKENILTLSDVMSAGKDNYVVPDKREEVLDVLYSLQSTGLISVLKSKDKVWVVVNKGILLTEVNGILFAPKTFKEHVDIASNTGIVSMSGLNRLFPKYDPDMLICFLKNMELCQELDPSFLRMTNLHQLAVGEEEEGGRERRGERLLFFPCLLSTDRPDEMTSEVYQFGWCLQCTSKHHFFPPRYFHVLSLHLAYKMALPQEDDKLNRYCTFWKNGLYWFNGHGVGSLVEIVDESQCVLVMMSCEKGYSDNMVSLRRDVIGEVMSVYKESCPSLEVKELVIDPKELAYPVNTPRERTVYSVKAVLSAVVEQRPFLVTTGTRRTELKEILPDESLSNISNLSLLGGRDIKEVIEITEEFKTQLTLIKLDIKDLDTVIIVLTSDQHLPCAVWRRLGLQLGLYDDRLMTIDTDYRGQSVECFHACMSAWLRGEDKVREKGGPSWSSLATALDTIGEKFIASYIRDKYCNPSS
uniref:Death domain-containing protein n=1 Tax=Amphimedon queenslandica TaxID=400682 RepID=A0A1X7U151_AMPQE